LTHGGGGDGFPPSSSFGMSAMITSVGAHASMPIEMISEPSIK
jgi:hypothetical protein